MQSSDVGYSFPEVDIFRLQIRWSNISGRENFAEYNGKQYELEALYCASQPSCSSAVMFQDYPISDVGRPAHLVGLSVFRATLKSPAMDDNRSHVLVC